jgi:hypothetical protein
MTRPIWGCFAVREVPYSSQEKPRPSGRRRKQRNYSAVAGVEKTRFGLRLCRLPSARAIFGSDRSNRDDYAEISAVQTFWRQNRGQIMARFPFPF